MPSKKPQFDVVKLILKMNHEIDNDIVCFKRNKTKPGRAIDQFSEAIEEVLNDND